MTWQARARVAAVSVGPKPKPKNTVKLYLPFSHLQFDACRSSFAVSHLQLNTNAVVLYAVIHLQFHICSWGTFAVGDIWCCKFAVSLVIIFYIFQQYKCSLPQMLFTLSQARTNALAINAVQVRVHICRSDFANHWRIPICPDGCVVVKMISVRQEQQEHIHLKHKYIEE